MESLQALKKRLKSVVNINQITKAMELVASTKMRKSQEIALASRPYAFAALDLLAKISAQEISLPELLKKRKVEKTLFVLMTSDKGLAGSFNSSSIKKFEEFLEKNKISKTGDKNIFCAIGEKAASYFQNRGMGASRKFVRVGDYVEPEQIAPISDFLIEGFLKKEWDRVLIFSANFKSALKQEILQRQIFPISVEAIKKTVKEIVPETGKFAELAKEQNISFLPEKIDEYLIEPSPDYILKGLASHLIKMQLYHLILEANASEHAARRLAMKNASDNAGELSEKLTLEYNKLRQAVITKEIIEITSGAQSLEN